MRVRKFNAVVALTGSCAAVSIAAAGPVALEFDSTSLRTSQFACAWEDAQAAPGDSLPRDSFAMDRAFGSAGMHDFRFLLRPEAAAGDSWMQESMDATLTNSLAIVPLPNALLMGLTGLAAVIGGSMRRRAVRRRG